MDNLWLRPLSLCTCCFNGHTIFIHKKTAPKNINARWISRKRSDRILHNLEDKKQELNIQWFMY